MESPLTTLSRTDICPYNGLFGQVEPRTGFPSSDRPALVRHADFTDKRRPSISSRDVSRWQSRLPQGRRPTRPARAATLSRCTTSSFFLFGNRPRAGKQRSHGRLLAACSGRLRGPSTPTYAPVRDCYETRPKRRTLVRPCPIRGSPTHLGRFLHQTFKIWIA